MSDKLILDCRGLPCPQPVIATKKALERGEHDFVVVVDNTAARENVSKFAVSQGCGVQVETEGMISRIVVTTAAGSAPEFPAAPPATVGAGGNLRYLLTQETLGHGSGELGAVLVKSFLVALKEKTPLPTTLMLINGGVKLACTGSAVLEHLLELSRQGVEILACGTCLDYYGLKEELKVGSVTNMYTLVDLMTEGKLVTL
ncbi:MAG TPA: sulfurtransferase-like selenium metabolism protein YedF [Patescibacteria group bacterium]|nr:sulfurtransferase-like selenium metabolism protein YedF [Patescibacteria group bacterium]